MNCLNLSRLLPATMLLTVVGSAHIDAQTVTDHPLISRFKGSGIVGDSSVIEFDEYPLITGPLKNSKYPVRKIEGKITHLHYMNPEGRSTLEVFRSYQNAVKQAGFTTIFSCSDLECGDPVNDATYSRWLGYWCEGNVIQCEEPMRYIAAKLSRPTGDVYVAIQVKTNGVNAEDGTYLNVIETRPMDDGLVNVNPASSGATPPSSQAAAPVAIAPEPASLPETYKPGPRPQAEPVTQELFAGTALTVRMIDSVDSQRDSLGQRFRASLDKPVNDAHGNMLIPRGSDVVIRLVDDKESGKLAGRTVLTLELVSVNVNGRNVDVDTVGNIQESSSRTARSTRLIGGGGAAGAIIGALAGGSKGAAIGAISGAAAGTTAELVTKGQRVRVPSEARLTFILRQPARI